MPVQVEAVAVPSSLVQSSIAKSVNNQLNIDIVVHFYRFLKKTPLTFHDGCVQEMETPLKLALRFLNYCQ
ncbi:hypothetical protein D5018_04475 [Parashewanella curva]|uniref:Uncharacterized protein n=1 Tax=Parashewanella curva TaxID=2338552 RepID=A0A3L8PZV8_9GAMM|nr:hypothetical protein D5018_04475 [Parashewanella curva]